NLRMNGFNTVENMNSRLWLSGKDGVSVQAFGRTFMNFSNDGTDFIASPVVYDRTYSGSANVFITGYGTLGRITSASKYKLNIKEANSDKIADRILLLEPKTWYDKFSVERYAEYLTKKYNGDEDVDKMEVPYLKRHYG